MPNNLLQMHLKLSQKSNSKTTDGIANFLHANDVFVNFPVANNNSALFTFKQELAGKIAAGGIKIKTLKYLK